MCLRFEIQAVFESIVGEIVVESPIMNTACDCFK